MFVTINAKSWIGFSGANNIRLEDGPGPWKGRLDIFYNNKWGSVCWDSWTSRNTDVVCKMLRYT